MTGDEGRRKGGSRLKRAHRGVSQPDNPGAKKKNRQLGREKNQRKKLNPDKRPLRGSRARSATEVMVITKGGRLDQNKKDVLE